MKAPKYYIWLIVIITWLPSCTNSKPAPIHPAIIALRNAENDQISKTNLKAAERLNESDGNSSDLSAYEVDGMLEEIIERFLRANAKSNTKIKAK
uniref:Uncharacterized protein n=1 Tax=Setaria digitata TaxID=48799 RepID=A0A915Q669_9BILA